MYSQIIKEGFLNLETVPEAKTLTNRGTFHKQLTLMILHPPHFAEGFLKDLRRDQQKTNIGPSALGGCPGHIPLVRTRHSSTRPPNTTQRRSLIKKRRADSENTQIVVKTRGKQIQLAHLYQLDRVVLDQQGTKSSW